MEVEVVAGNLNLLFLYAGKHLIQMMEVPTSRQMTQGWPIKIIYFLEA